MSPLNCIAFCGPVQVASGLLPEVAAAVKRHVGDDPNTPVLIFDDHSSELIELDLRGSPEDVLGRLPQPAPTAEATPAARPRGRGRPRLGVVSREVTLLPRHWDWLRAQPGGASVTLRKLVEQACKAGRGSDRVRTLREAAYRFMQAACGDLPDFEEASRALFAGDLEAFEACTRAWPRDLRAHANKLARRTLADEHA